MNERDLNKKLLNIMEGVSFNSFGMPQVSAEPEVSGSVEFKQHKNTDKGSVSIEASADDMQELSKVLKLAGLTLPSDMNADQDPIQPEKEEEPEVVADSEVAEEDCPRCDDPECSDEECEEDDGYFGGTKEYEDVSYSTDKEEIVNSLRAKLQNILS